jgi:flagellin-like hook-associated protein FlgL
MAGITGADTSLLQVAAVNSHRFAGVLAQRSDWNADGLINGTDLQAEVAIISRTLAGGSDVGTGSIREVEPALVSGTAANGESITAAIHLSRVFGSFAPVGGIIQETPTMRNAVAYARIQSGEISQLASPIYSDSNKTLSISFNFTTTGTTAIVSLDLSDLRYQSRDLVGGFTPNLPPDGPFRQSAIGFTNILGTFSSGRALDTVKNRIEDVSALEGNLGALESRLRVAQSVLGASGENFAAASSRIKDADIAAESANVVRTQILQQTSASLLGQANLAPQIGLQLLQNA